VVQDDPEAAIAFVDDDVSGVYNRRFFACALERMWRRQRLALLFIDLDHFGKINKDTQLGYAVGDETLQHAAQIILRSSRWPAFVCRLGGDEFAVLIRKSSREEVLRIAHRIRYDIEAHVFPQRLRLTASIGIGTKPGMHSMSKDDLFAFADLALRRAKQNRNCVIEGEYISSDPAPEIP
jgi:diguanylate cyclase (GGDEF)-like protein